jgi:hypothetical protein
LRFCETAKLCKIVQFCGFVFVLQRYKFN